MILLELNTILLIFRSLLAPACTKKSFYEIFNLAIWRVRYIDTKNLPIELNACAPMAVRIQITKFKFHQYQWRAISPNLIARYTVDWKDSFTLCNENNTHNHNKWYSRSFGKGFFYLVIWWTIIIIYWMMHGIACEPMMLSIHDHQIQIMSHVPN